MEKETLDKLNSFLDENRGKRKFSQSVELSVNFHGIDFNKQDNRLNMDVMLPNGKGKASGAIVFADDKNIASSAEQAGAKVIGSAQLPSVATDKAALNELLSSDLLAQPNLMPQIAKTLGQFLGPRGKMPKPIAGSNVAAIIGNAGKSLHIRSKGKYLPTINCMVGTEKMGTPEIAANIDEVVGALSKKVGKQNIKSVYVKLTMSKPIRIV
ncbi:MAG: hypothetical protein M1474_02730 [Candidatus Marsarchaeota archaeon]|jgi:large subunit ribosomal protein L1|nr:hypothetical protein [Candidatus Marsarchaeota archaeon]